MSAELFYIAQIVLIIIVYVLSIAIAVGIGANDETLATIAGTGKLKLQHVLIIGVICAIVGAVVFGQGTSETIGSDLLNEQIRTAPFILAIISSTIFWLLLSSIKSLPVSTTHTVVGSAIGVGILSIFLPFTYFTPFSPPIYPEGIIKVLIGWVTSPLVGYFLTYGVHKLISRFIMKNLKGMESIEKAEKIFIWLLLGIIIFTALTRAGNDVANSIGIVTGFQFKLPIPFQGTPIYTTFLLFISGIGMAIGLFVIGRRVIRNVGSNIVQMKPSDAFSVELSVMIAMTVFTILGMPISGTQVLIFAILGSSKAKKEKPNTKAIKKILISWAITIPVAAAVAIGFFLLFFPISFMLGW
ncbi:MAG: inorganic phosphate transporter [Candidatus Helarchaeales archaeon]